MILPLFSVKTETHILGVASPVRPFLFTQTQKPPDSTDKNSNFTQQDMRVAGLPLPWLVSLHDYCVIFLLSHMLKHLIYTC